MMDEMLRNAIMTGSGNISLTMTARDLRAVISDVVTDVLNSITAQIGDDGLLTGKETQRRLKIGRTKLWRLAKEGSLVPVKIGNKTLYRSADVKELMKRDKALQMMCDFKNNYENDNDEEDEY